MNKWLHEQELIVQAYTMDISCVYVQLINLIT